MLSFDVLCWILLVKDVPLYGFKCTVRVTSRAYTGLAPARCTIETGFWRYTPGMPPPSLLLNVYARWVCTLFAVCDMPILADLVPEVHSHDATIIRSSAATVAVELGARIARRPSSGPTVVVPSSLSPAVRRRMSTRRRRVSHRRRRH